MSNKSSYNHDTSQYINYDKVGKSISQTLANKKQKLINEYLKNPTICKFCQKQLPYEKRKYKFCTRSCSSSYNSKLMSNETKQRISKSVIKFRIEHPEIANKWTSTHINNKHFNSKGEKELLNIIQNQFPQFHFTCGSLRKIAERTYKSLDIYSNELKLIIEYDGVYHFKNIYNNLEQVQLKDELLNKWCINNNWKIIRVNEITYINQKDKVLSTIFELINNHQTIPIISKLYWEWWD